MKKTANDFKIAAKLIKPTKWKIRDCSLCGYTCGYVFSPCYEYVGYDSGCHCTNTQTITERTWEDIVTQYNFCLMYPESLQRANEFWGFTSCT